MATNKMKQFNRVALMHDIILACTDFDELINDNSFMNELHESLSSVSQMSIKGYVGIKRVLQMKFAQGDYSDFEDGMKHKAYDKKLSATKFFLRQGLVDLKEAELSNDGITAQALLADIKNTIHLIHTIESNKPLVFSRKGGEGRKIGKSAADWETTFIDRILLSNSKYKIPALVQYITGCRPAELQSQIVVTINNQQLRFRIKGVKVDATKGQDSRELFFDIDMDNLAIAEIFRQVKSHQLKFSNGTLTEGLMIGKRVAENSGYSVPSYDSYKDFVNRCGEGLIRGAKLNPYFLRHAFASRLKTFVANGRKKSELTDAEMQLISACMGHASTKTQDYYGRFCRGGSGGLCPDVAKTIISKTVRLTGSKKSVKKVPAKAQLIRRGP